MSKQSFEYLLEKYMAEECNAAEKKIVEQWFELVGNDSQLPKTEPEWNQVKDKMWRKIYQHETPTKKPILLWSISRYKLAMAASITLLIGLGVYLSLMLNNKNQLITSESAGVITQKNESDKIIPLKLEDGSIIQLHPEASLSYPKHFLADKREVTLNGNAFFDIKRNPNKPFMVLCGETITKVLGTSFLIKSDLNSKIQIEVKTGKVSVYEKGAINPKENGVVLTPNEKVVYFNEDDHFVTGLVEKPEVLVTVKDKISFDFKNTKLEDVLQKFKDAYGIEIFLEDEKIANCTFTGDLNSMPIYNQLDFLCQSLNANYQIKGTDIIVSGKGCF